MRCAPCLLSWRLRHSLNAPASLPYAPSSIPPCSASCSCTALSLVRRTSRRGVATRHLSAHLSLSSAHHAVRRRTHRVHSFAYGLHVCLHHASCALTDPCGSGSEPSAVASYPTMPACLAPRYGPPTQCRQAPRERRVRLLYVELHLRIVEHRIIDAVNPHRRMPAVAHRRGPAVSDTIVARLFPSLALQLPLPRDQLLQQLLHRI